MYSKFGLGRSLEWIGNTISSWQPLPNKLVRGGCGGPRGNVALTSLRDRPPTPESGMEMMMMMMGIRGRKKKSLGTAIAFLFSFASSIRSFLPSSFLPLSYAVQRMSLLPLSLPPSPSLLSAAAFGVRPSRPRRRKRRRPRAAFSRPPTLSLPAHATE